MTAIEYSEFGHAEDLRVVEPVTYRLADAARARTALADRNTGGRAALAGG